MRIRATAIAAAIILLAAFLYVVGVRVQNSFVVENQTGQAISSARIEICDEIYDFGVIPVGGQSWQGFHIACDGGYRVLASLRDGSRIAGADGYVTTGY